MLSGGLGGFMLLAAFWFQYVEDLAPCTMCYWQRWPHGVMIGLALIAWFIGNPAPRLLAGLACMIMLTSAGLGFWHAGVELGLLPGPNTCSGTIALDGTAGEILDSLLSTPPIRCDEVVWSFSGISMAGWNGLISLATALLIVLMITKDRDHG